VALALWVLNNHGSIHQILLVLHARLRSSFALHRAVGDHTVILLADSNALVRGEVRAFGRGRFADPLAGLGVNVHPEVVSLKRRRIELAPLLVLIQLE